MEGKWSNWSVLCLKLPTIITPLCPNLHKNSGLKWYSWIWIDYDGIELIFSTNFNIETLEICINLCHLVCGMKTWKHAFMTALIEYKYLSICTLISVSYKYWKEEDNFAGFHDFMNSCCHAFVPTSHKYLALQLIQSFKIPEGLKIYKYLSICNLIPVSYKHWKEEDIVISTWQDFMISWIHAFMLLYPLPTSTWHCNCFSLSRFLKGWRYT